MLQTVLNILVSCGVWITGGRMNKKCENLIRSFWAGFCMAEGIAGLCGRCTWMYSVVFGELFGFVMLAVTVVGGTALFSLLSGTGSLLLTSFYIFFFSAESEYQLMETPIISAAAKGMRTGLAGLNDTAGKKLPILLASSAAGNLLSMSDTQLPAAFAAISCCALLAAGIKNVSADRWCAAGAVTACLLAYL